VILQQLCGECFTQLDTVNSCGQNAARVASAFAAWVKATHGRALQASVAFYAQWR
jgi:hypothetical protein